MVVEIITWVVVGLLAGAIVGLTYPGKRRNILGSMLAGVLGSSIAGVIYSAFLVGEAAVTISIQTTLVFIVSLFIFVGITSILSKRSD